eukprot:TRINITY_DN30935_c0_g1_i1.p1 TRINITY_DN30935_c0_g1~~TRINITY_DN30935_c0_g1_i1.p1  ORF type:complete len:154 (+),score=23.34 TRINITY_DN30935_c0_g1_i1:140-601(+)
MGSLFSLGFQASVAVIEVVVGLVYPAYCTFIDLHPNTVRPPAVAEADRSRIGSGSIPGFGTSATSISARSSASHASRAAAKCSEQWLAYWIILGAMWCVEYVLWPVLCLVPVYRLLRIPFLIFLSAGRGAQWLYDRHITPELQRRWPGMYKRD